MYVYRNYLTKMNRKSAVLNAMLQGKSVNEIEQLIQNGSDVNYKTTKGLSPLKFALKENNKAYINLLFKHNVDFGKLKNPLFKAIEYDVDVEVVQQLIDRGNNVNGFDISEKPLLFHAAKNASLNVIKLLIENGADYNYEALYCIDKSGDKNYGNVLYVAMYYDRSWEIIEYLASLEDLLNKENREKETPLMILCAYASDAGKVKKYLALGAAETLNNANVLGGKAIHYANVNETKAQKAIQELVASSEAPIILLLRAIFNHYPLEEIKKMSKDVEDLNFIFSDGGNLLHAAALDTQNLKLIQFLLKEKVNPNQKTNDGELPVHLAMSKLHFQHFVPLSSYEINYRKNAENLDEVNRYLLDDSRFSKFHEKNKPEVDIKHEAEISHATMEFDLNEQKKSQIPLMIKELIKAGSKLSKADKAFLDIHNIK